MRELSDTLKVEQRAWEKEKKDVNTCFARLRLITLLMKEFSVNILLHLFLIWASIDWELDLRNLFKLGNSTHIKSTDLALINFSRFSFSFAIENALSNQSSLNLFIIAWNVGCDARQ
jgi:hypothetical protein